MWLAADNDIICDITMTPSVGLIRVPHPHDLWTGNSGTRLYKGLPMMVRDARARCLEIPSLA